LVSQAVLRRIVNLNLTAFRAASAWGAPLYGVRHAYEPTPEVAEAHAGDPRAEPYNRHAVHRGAAGERPGPNWRPAVAAALVRADARWQCGPRDAFPVSVLTARPLSMSSRGVPGFWQRRASGRCTLCGSGLLQRSASAQQLWCGRMPTGSGSGADARPSPPYSNTWTNREDSLMPSTRTACRGPYGYLARSRLEARQTAKYRG
jgi:hypothetical protein